MEHEILKAGLLVYTGGDMVLGFGVRSPAKREWFVLPDQGMESCWLQTWRKTHLAWGSFFQLPFAKEALPGSSTRIGCLDMFNMAL